MEHLLTMKFLKIAAISILIFVFLDLLWIGFIASKFYLKQLGYLATIKNEKIIFNLPVGIVVQILISFGLSVFIFLSTQYGDSLSAALLCGGFLGFVIYFTYDMTNYSFIKDWPLSVCLFDIAWGTFQGAAAGIYVYYLSKWIS